MDEWEMSYMKRIGFFPLPISPLSHSQWRSRLVPRLTSVVNT